MRRSDLAGAGFQQLADVDQNQAVTIPHGAYDASFVARLKERGMDIVEVAATTSEGLRGTLAAANQPRVMVFNVEE